MITCIKKLTFLTALSLFVHSAMASLIIEDTATGTNVNITVEGLLKSSSPLKNNSSSHNAGALLFTDNSVSVDVSIDKERMSVLRNVFTGYKVLGKTVPGASLRIWNNSKDGVNPQAAISSVGDLYTYERSSIEWDDIDLDEIIVGDISIESETGVTPEGDFKISVSNATGLGELEDRCVMYGHRFFRNAKLETSISDINNENVETGLMFREDVSPDSKYFAVVSTKKDGLWVKWRQEKKGEMKSRRLEADINFSLVEKIRLVRNDDFFEVQYKLTGSDSYISFPQRIAVPCVRGMYGGLFLTSSVGGVQTSYGTVSSGVVLIRGVNMFAIPAYVQTYNYQMGGNNNKIGTIAFTDGFGNAIQSQVTVGDGQTMVSSQEFDQFGRSTKSYKPFPLNDASLSFFEGDVYEKAKEITSDDVPYAENRYNDDVLGEIKESAGPGTVYSIDNGHGSQVWYGSVTSANAFLTHAQLQLFATDKTKTIDEVITATGTKSYFLTVTRDPNGDFSQVIKDSWGREVATRVYAAADKPIETRAKYDLLGRVVEEISPIGVEELNSEELETLYKNVYSYNAVGDKTVEKMMDESPISYVYDKNGRVKSFTQKVSGEVAVTIENEYDEHNRVVKVYATKTGEARVLKKIFIYDDVDKLIPLKTVGNLLYTPELLTLQDASLQNGQGKLVGEIAYSEYSIAFDAPAEKVIYLYDYDKQGRIRKKYSKIPGVPNWSTVEYSYDLQGKLLQKNMYANGSSTPVELNYHYNSESGRLEYLAKGERPLVGYEYTFDGKLKKKHYYSKTARIDLMGNVAESPVKSCEYEYNIRDWVTGIRPATGSSGYSEVLSYDGDKSYTGNVSKAVHDYNATGVYDLSYTYDNLSRLTNVTHNGQTGSNFNEAFTYDLNNRFETKSVAGVSSLTYQYEVGSNRLRSVNGGNEFTYNDDGTMATDAFNASTIEYDWRKMPVRFNRDEGNISVVMIYDNAGNRVAKIHDKATPEVGYTNAVFYDGAMVYTSDGSGVKLSEISLDGEGTLHLNLSNASDGTGNVTTENIVFYTKDHLGSTRESFSVETGTTEQLQQKMYAAYGELSSPSKSADEDVRFTFTGKEFDTEGGVINDVTGKEDDGIGLYYFGARYYNPLLGMWTTTDPKRQFFSGYSYGTNPTNGIDYDGQEHFTIGTPEQLDAAYRAMEQAYGIYIGPEHYKEFNYNGLSGRKLLLFSPILDDNVFLKPRLQLLRLISDKKNYLMTFSGEKEHIFGKLTQKGPTEKEAEKLNLDIRENKMGDGAYIPSFRLTYLPPDLITGECGAYTAKPWKNYNRGGFENVFRRIFLGEKDPRDAIKFELWDVILHETMHAYEDFRGLYPDDADPDSRTSIEIGVQLFVNDIREYYGKLPRIK